ncbi:class I SAM-dependent methyltransferase [Roseobacter sp.]|uniref:class I SAM-dependent DNA methyltransferase n=1 Tax=Roseobacter sp. TaxID=1907202 RepID=UPI003298277C
MTDAEYDYDSWAWLYDRTLGPDYSRRKMGFFDRVVLGDLPPGARVLDLCCGTGQMMAHMHARGLAVTGLDMSRDMLAYARKNVPGTELIEGDARDFTLPDPVSAVICASASLNHIATRDDLAQVFRAVAAALKDGGTFVFDINHPAQMARHWTGTPAAGDIRPDYAWMITPRYDAAAATGSFTVDMFRRSTARPVALWAAVVSALMRRRFMTAAKLARLHRMTRHHPGWDHTSVTYPVHAHPIETVLELLKGAGLHARAETLAGGTQIGADSAACFIAQKPGSVAKDAA